MLVCVRDDAASESVWSAAAPALARDSSPNFPVGLVDKDLV